MASVTVTIKRQNGVNITATSTDIDDEAIIELAMMLGALVFDSVSTPLTPETEEPDESELVPVTPPSVSDQLIADAS